MVQLRDPMVWIEEEAPPSRWLPTVALPFGLAEFDRAMPRVYRQPAAPRFTRGSKNIRPILTRARKAVLNSDRPEFGKAYGELTAEFQPGIRWACSCWEYLLSMEGCRFLCRSEQEKLYSRGDYRAFAERDFERLVYRIFKECLLSYLRESPADGFERTARRQFWPKISSAYRSLENPPDPNQRKLTGWSYLRCIPYRFLNSHHQERVDQLVKRLPDPLRQAIELYHLCFYREETASASIQITPLAFRRRRLQALRRIAEKDYLSYILLRQIERY